MTIIWPNLLLLENPNFNLPTSDTFRVRVSACSLVPFQPASGIFRPSAGQSERTGSWCAQRFATQGQSRPQFHVRSGWTIIKQWLMWLTIINHSPVITINRWYVYHSQMGSLCFKPHYLLLFFIDPILGLDTIQYDWIIYIIKLWLYILNISKHN